MPKYVVLGRTRKGNSKMIIGRFKSPEELRDVFEVDKLTQYAKRLAVYEVLDVYDKGAWYLISFDIKGWRYRDPSGTVYSKIKEAMYRIPCGKVDQSTYICPVDASNIPREETSYVRVWLVKPSNENAKYLTAESIMIAIMETIERLRSRVTKTKGNARKKTMEIADMVRTNYRAVLEKLDEIGLGDIVRNAITIADSVYKMAKIKKFDEKIALDDEITVEVHAENEKYTTFADLDPTIEEDTPSLYLGVSVSNKWGKGRIGQCQANIVGEKALIWECVIYSNPYLLQDRVEANKKLLKWFEGYLKKFGVKEYIVNTREPEYPGRVWEEILKEMGYTVEGERAVKKL